MSTATEGLQQSAVAQHCKLLRLPTVAGQCRRLAEQAEREHHTYLAYLEALLIAEVEERERRVVGRRLLDAHLPRVKTLEEFDFSQTPLVSPASIAALAEGGYIQRAEPVVLPGKDRGLGHGQDALAHGALRCRLPAEAAGAVHHRGQPGERTGGGQAATATPAGAGPLGPVRRDRHR